MANVTTDKTYNGWKNRSTWNVALWLNNDEHLYRAMQEHTMRARAISRFRKVTAASAKRFVTKGLGWTRTPDGDRIGSVDWAAIAADMEASI